MLGDEQLALLADPVFYDRIDRWQPDLGLALCQRPDPEGWQRTARGPWQVLRPRAQVMPDQGWKIHVSGCPGNAERLCRAVWDYCVPREIPFKFLRDQPMVLAWNSKYAPRASSGKLVTIYPRDDDGGEQLGATLGELSALLDGEDGPYILGDLRWGAGPLFVRYGGFVANFCRDERGVLRHCVTRPDGTRVPDRRQPVFTWPDWVELPEFLRPHLSARQRSGVGGLPYEVVSALHFSNGGGVYLARDRRRGDQVVIKEARPFAGLDDHGTDALARLRQERDALAALAETEGVPALRDYLAVAGHEFLVMDHVAGEPLYVWQGRRHPLVVGAGEPAAIGAYRADAVALYHRARDLIARVHARGYSFGDLHPGNLIVGADGSLTLVDFELAGPLASAGTPGLGAAGFTRPGLTGQRRDLYALAALGLWLFLPLNRVLALDQAKLGDYLGFIATRFGADEDFLGQVRAELEAAPDASRPAASGPGRARRAPDWRAVERSLRDAIALSATPEREDRLFPGGTRQFTEDAIGLANGASGVLWALSVTGCGSYPEHERWLIDAIRRAGQQRLGCYDGVHGMAYAVGHLGYPELAAELLDAALPRTEEIVDVGLYRGLAGVGLCYADAWQRLGRAGYLDAAAGIARHLAQALDGRERTALTVPRAGEAGLMRGWSGPGLLFRRMHDVTGEVRWLELARRAVEADLDQCVATAAGSLQVEQPGVRTLAYLEAGSAGILLVAAELPEDSRGPRLDAAMPALIRACQPELVLQAGLFTGRAGLIAALARVRDQRDQRDQWAAITPVIERHLARLDWHLVNYHGNAAIPGEQSYRLSMDLATGTAGALLAVHAATSGDEAGFLPFFAVGGHGRR